MAEFSIDRFVDRYAKRTSGMSASEVRALFAVASRPDVVSLAGGMPFVQALPTEQVLDVITEVLRDVGTTALQYGGGQGQLGLRERLVMLMEQEGLAADPEDVVVTTGAQQALDLVGKIFVDPGDLIAVEAPAYVGALTAFGAYEPRYLTLDLDENGMIVDELEAALRVGPKFIYVLPNFQNPSGSTLSLERRIKLIELADKYGVPIVEDDPYGQLRYEGEHIPSLVYLDSQYREKNGGTYSGNVIYLSTFSKLLAPGLRLAWVVAPPEVIKKLVMTKQAADLHTSSFNQYVAYEVAKGGFLDEHVKVIRATYKERRNVMLEMMDEMFPSEVRWTHPLGGMFLWGIMPENVDAADVLRIAIDRKVAFVPGSSFHPNGGGKNTMRLNFSYSNPEVIREGITRLGTTLKEVLKKNGYH